jgi:hypothetical protein
MILRTVFVKLHDEWSTARGRTTVIAQTREALQAIPGTIELVVGTPADGHSTAAWDLCIQIRFDDLNAAQKFADHPLHRAHIDDFLKPKMVVIKAWNFEI